MLDFTPFHKQRVTMLEFTRGLGVTDLRALAAEAVSRELAAISTCIDADVVFEPIDPLAEDRHATAPR